MNKSSTSKTCIELTLSQEAWTKVQSIAAELDITVSELLEQVSQGELVIVDAETMEEIEDRLDLQDALESEADPENQERIPWEQVKQELGL